MLQAPPTRWTAGNPTVTIPPPPPPPSVSHTHTTQTHTRTYVHIIWTEISFPPFLSLRFVCRPLARSAPLRLKTELFLAPPAKSRAAGNQAPPYVPHNDSCRVEVNHAAEQGVALIIHPGQTNGGCAKRHGSLEDYVCLYLRPTLSQGTQHSCAVVVYDLETAFSVWYCLLVDACCVLIGCVHMHVYCRSSILQQLYMSRIQTHDNPALPEFLLHLCAGPGSSSLTIDPGSESTSEMMCGGGGGDGSGGMTSSFTWLESVNSTMDEIKTLIVNQEVRHTIMSPEPTAGLTPSYRKPALV